MEARNLLFIMCDQLRADHLSCYGHPRLNTPNLDALAARGVQFDNAFVQSGVCGPSRMSFYTGRYVSSHGATWNRVPLSVAELTLGDYLRAAGRALTLVGKTHVMPDRAGLARFALDGTSELGALLARGSFNEALRHDGHHAEPAASYADWLRAQGYAGDDPWTEYVISVTDDAGRAQSGWHMRNCRWPARVREEHSETAYTTDRALEFIRAQGDSPWALHLSYVKPHWPYVAPAPYHALYSSADALPVQRAAAELDDPHPVLAAYRRQEECVNFMRDEVIEVVRPAYMGLVRQIDDHLGRLWRLLEELGRWRDTLVVFTSDHGDFLGDHWLGEKEHFFDAVTRVPLIAAAPGGASGRRIADFVEAIDVVPTVLDALGMAPAEHRVEGRSLAPWLAGATPAEWREAVFAELDFSYREARRTLGLAPDRGYAWMVRTADWKYVHWLDLPPQLFDLRNDPQELHDLGRAPGCEPRRDEMRRRLLDWFVRLKRRTTVTLAQVEEGTAAYKRAGVFYGQW
ncbi:MAG: alkaline phosphatase family protein [Gemmatimonadota bacterium]